MTDAFRQLQDALLIVDEHERLTMRQAAFDTGGFKDFKEWVDTLDVLDLPEWIERHLKTRQPFMPTDCDLGSRLWREQRIEELRAVMAEVIRKRKEREQAAA